MSVFKTICKKVSEVSPDIKVSIEKNCIVLGGELSNWEDIVKAGKAAVSKKYIGVINNIALKGFKGQMKMPKLSDNKHDGRKPDVLIIGGGVSGTAIARELSKWKLDIMLVEKDYDVALGASSRNDGCVHVGIDLKPGLKKLKYNGWGNKIYGKLCDDLGVPFERKGHLLLMYHDWEKRLVPIVKLHAKILGIKGVRYMPLTELKEYEPEVAEWAKGAYFMPSGGIVSPYKLTVALAENAVSNGAELCFNTAVVGMNVVNGEIKSVKTNRGIIYPKLVINASGTYSDVIADMAGDRTFTIHPRKGINLIMDKKIGHITHTSISKMPFIQVPANYKEQTLDKNLKDSLKEYKQSKASSSNSKGGGVIHTADDNVLVGPNAIETPEREDYSTDMESIKAIFGKQSIISEKMKMGDVITYFAGVRAPTYEEDFVVRKGIFTKNIIQVAGIQSPGLTAAPAIALDVEKWAVEMLSANQKVDKNNNYNPIRKPIPHLASMNEVERNELIKQNPDYGEIICRCEEISKGEIIDAINSPIPVYTVDAIKRRVRPGMGRCQGGFCSPLVIKILAEQAGVSIEEIKKAGEESKILYSKTKGGN